MSHRNACQLVRLQELRMRWLTICDRLGVAKRIAVPQGRRLLGSWDRVPRHYHDTRHLLACLRALDSVDAEQPGAMADRLACELALWFHDAVYWPRRPDNEAQSAAWARRFLAEARQPASLADAVGFLVMQTQHAAVSANGDAQWVVDIDLGILGQPPAVYARFEADVRREYRHVPEPVWRQRRPAVLQSFLDRNSIYSTPFFRDRLEAQARANLAQAIRTLHHGAMS